VSFEWAEALKKGPVVLYFYPKAFTSGCTVEAHLFAEAADEFTKYHTTVIGISNDDIDTLKKFSVEECRNKFSVGADPDGKIIKAYDAKMLPLGNTSRRASYVITPDGKIFYVYSSMSPKEHVTKTMEAVKAWKN
jgi:peroxiredoxin Q/BCP